MAKQAKRVRNLFGELVAPVAPLPKSRRKPVQQVLFDNTLTEEVLRARQLAQQHREEGGKDLFEEGAE